MIPGAMVLVPVLLATPFWLAAALREHGRVVGCCDLLDALEGRGYPPRRAR